jgi:hypothetical protein
MGAAGNPGAGVDLMSWCVSILYCVISCCNVIAGLSRRVLFFYFFARKLTRMIFIVSLVPFSSLLRYRYMEIPVVSRVYLTGAFLTTAGCAVDLISPFSLYFNWDLIFSQGQIWRLVTSYLFFGVFSVDFLFHMYFLVSYLLEGLLILSTATSNPPF